MKEIKLTDFEKNNLSKKEMNDINGGDIWTCTCSCLYASNGGSSEMDNGCANATITGGGHSKGGANQYKQDVYVFYR